MPGMKSNQETSGLYNSPVSFWHNFPDIGIKKWIIVSSALFFTGIVIGLVNPSTEALESLESLLDIADTTVPFSSIGFFILYLINNVFKMVLSFVFSPILCILPVLSLVANGWVISSVGYFIVDVQQYSIVYFLMGILPHGIFEIPALIIGQAAALSLGTMTIAAIFSEGKRRVLFDNLKENLKYLGIVVLLLVIAAAIEAFITPLILGLLE
jgi:stage II sporulation protein M